MWQSLPHIYLCFFSLPISSPTQTSIYLCVSACPFISACMYARIDTWVSVWFLTYFTTWWITIVRAGICRSYVGPCSNLSHSVWKVKFSGPCEGEWGTLPSNIFQLLGGRFAWTICDALRNATRAVNHFLFSGNILALLTVSRRLQPTDFGHSWYKPLVQTPFQLRGIHYSHLPARKDIDTKIGLKMLTTWGARSWNPFFFDPTKWNYYLPSTMNISSTFRTTGLPHNTGLQPTWPFGHRQLLSRHISLHSPSWGRSTSYNFYVLKNVISFQGPISKLIEGINIATPRNT